MIAGLYAAAHAMAYSVPAWRSASAPASAAGAEALASTLHSLSWPSDAAPPDIVLLTVPQEHHDSLEAFSADVARELSARVVIGVLGMAIGAGKEFDGDEPGISVVAGTLPEQTAVTPFVVSANRMPSFSELFKVQEEEEQDRPGFLIFADPFSAVTQVTSLLNDLCPSSVVAGGLSCPISDTSPSLALYQSGARCRALAPGSLIGLRLGGPRFEMHSCCAQGAAPIGPSFLVTKGGGPNGNLCSELDGAPALQRLQEVAQEVAQGEDGARIVKMLQRALLVGSSIDEVSAGGASATGGEGGGESAGVPFDDEPDFLIRGVLGTDDEGGLYIGDQVTQGTTRVKFHYRDGQAAHEELALLLNKYRLTRAFSGRFDGERAMPLGCLLFSCSGRGRRMYAPQLGAEVAFEAADHDSTLVRAALAPELPIGGFFCNGELGPLGVKGLGEGRANTFLHGFTSVVALFYDTSERGETPQR